VKLFKLNFSLTVLSSVILQAVILLKWGYSSEGEKCTLKAHEFTYSPRNKEELRRK